MVKAIVRLSSPRQKSTQQRLMSALLDNVAESFYGTKVSYSTPLFVVVVAKVCIVSHGRHGMSEPF